MNTAACHCCRLLPSVKHYRDCEVRLSTGFSPLAMWNALAQQHSSVSARTPAELRSGSEVSIWSLLFYFVALECLKLRCRDEGASCRDFAAILCSRACQGRRLPITLAAGSQTSGVFDTCAKHHHYYSQNQIRDSSCRGSNAQFQCFLGHLHERVFDCFDFALLSLNARISCR